LGEPNLGLLPLLVEGGLEPLLLAGGLEDWPLFGEPNLGLEPLLVEGGLLDGGLEEGGLLPLLGDPYLGFDDDEEGRLLPELGLLLPLLRFCAYAPCSKHVAPRKSRATTRARGLPNRNMVTTPFYGVSSVNDATQFIGEVPPESRSVRLFGA